MDPDNHRVNTILLLCGVLAVGSGWWFLSRPEPKKPSGIGSFAEYDDRTSPSDLRSIRRGMRKDPAGSLAKLETLLEEQIAPAGRREAERLVPEVMLHLFQKAVKEERTGDAREILQRLRNEYPDTLPTKRASTQWGRHLGDEVRGAVRAGDAAAVDPLYDAYIDGEYYRPRVRDGRVYDGDDTVLTAYALWQAERWANLPENEKWTEEGKEILARSMHAWLDHNPTYKRYNLLNADKEKSPPARQWFTVAEAFSEQGEPVAALNAYLLARSGLRRGTPWDKGEEGNREMREMRLVEVESRIADLAVDLSNRAGPYPASALPPASRLANLLKSIDALPPRERIERAILDMAIGRFLEQTRSLTDVDLTELAMNAMPREARADLGSLLHDAMGDARNIRRGNALRLLQLELRKEGNDLSSGLSPELLDRVEASMPSDIPDNRLDATRRRLIRRVVAERPDLNPVPLPPVFRERHTLLLAVNGLYALSRAPDEAAADIRQVIRGEAPEDLKQRVKDALQTALRRAGSDADLAALIQLAGLYSAEFGDQLDEDPFAGEFLSLLRQAADHFQQNEPMKHLFTQSLIANGFPGTPAGTAAREHTIQGAFEAVASVRETPSSPAASPSSLPGKSSEAMDNSTDHHLLAVYDGPERFFVLCAPRRKGSLSLENGSYRVAVMTPIGSIQPFRTERILENQHVVSNYYVRTSGTKDQPVSRAHGDYRLLREGDKGRRNVDGKTGRLIEQP